MSAQKITTAGFLSEFLGRHEKMPDRPFCWVLGSGASVQSGIPTGGTLAMQWLTELHEMEDFDNFPIERWATAANLGIKGFDFKKAANSYPFIYQRRFRDFREEGYAFLEAVMQAAEPSYGYSVLAQIVSSMQHKVAVTTNFDNLIADAISTYTHDYPLVCGHESLTGFIRPNLKRPIIAKIHRDLLLNPKSIPEEIDKLPTEWETALQVIFENNTPIVIGYGGNDGSLMGFLRNIEPIKGGIFWCYISEDEPDPKIHEIVERHHGRLVPILGFDELMLQFWEKLKLPSPIPDLQKTHDKRVTEFQRQFQELNKKLKQPGETKATEKELKQVRSTAAAAVERLKKEEGWWAWQLRADEEPDPSKREAIYREGLKVFPNSAKLTDNFALFMHEARNDYDEAERLYRKAMELDPKDATIIGNFAYFIHEVRKDYNEAKRLYDEAERLYRKAMELEPKHANNTGNFALFMHVVRRNYDEAERLYRKAWELNPNGSNELNGLAWFLADVRKTYEEAELLARKAVEIDSKNGNNFDTLAFIIWKSGKDNAEAEILFQKALHFAPSNAYTFANYAEFLEKVQKNLPQANRHYQKALELNPNLDSVKKHYERFLKENPEFSK